MSYVRVPIFIPQTPKGKNALFIFVFCGMLIAAIMCGMVGFSSLKEKPIEKIENVAYTEIDSEYEYEFEQVYLVDEYAYLWQDDESNSREQYYIIYFKDKNGNGCFASLEADKSTEIGKQCVEYIENDSASIGDVVLKGLFSCKDISQQRNELETNYYEAYNKCISLIEGTNTGMHFSYDATNKDEFLQKRQTDTIIFLILFPILLLGSSLGLFFFIRQRIKLNRTNADINSTEEVNENQS